MVNNMAQLGQNSYEIVFIFDHECPFGVFYLTQVFILFMKVAQLTINGTEVAKSGVNKPPGGIIWYQNATW